MERDVRKNPSLLKLDLYCKGMRLDDSCFEPLKTGRPILRTRAGLGSGLEVVLPGRMWTNIPVTEAFTADSPYRLRQNQGHLSLELDGTFVCDVELAPQPGWYERPTSTGRKMRQVGTLQGTYLGIYPGQVCEYWTRDEKVNCRFCSVGLNLGHDDASEKNVAEVMEVVRAAMLESAITYVDFNTGHYVGETYLDLLEPYIRAVKEETGLLIGVQTPPHAELERYDALKRLGVNRVSFCFEIFDAQRFEEVCPGKHSQYGLPRYLEAVEYCAGLGRGSALRLSPWVTNGEIIAGLEAPASSIEAIDWITQRGAIPTVCVFRPLQGTDYADVPPPRTEDMIPVFARLYDACMEQGLPIGIAPNIHVSLVMLPEECAGLSDRPHAHRLQELKLAAMRTAFTAGWTRRMARKRRELLQRMASTPAAVSTAV
jgi:sodium-dependent dicarboxylate transporter 2/3/5